MEGEEEQKIVWNLGSEIDWTHTLTDNISQKKNWLKADCLRIDSLKDHQIPKIRRSKKKKLPKQMKASAIKMTA